VPFTKARLEALAPGGDVEIALEQGAQWLAGELGQWARLATGEQHRGPLQIFQTAMAFPTAALEDRGVAAPRRDVGAQRALPGDKYDLAPASSRDIGEEAWQAHVAWGIAKAKVMADAVPAPASQLSLAVAVVAMDRADRAAVEEVAAGRSLPVRLWRNPGAIGAGLAEEIPRWSVVDAGHAAADEAVRMLAAAGSKVAVYGPAPDDIAMARWMALGAATVVDRDRLVPVLESWLPRPV
jgi:hypothetical protein